MNLLRRLEALERGILRDPITLTMPNGRTKTMVAHGDYLLRLFLAAIGQESLSPKQAANLDLIRRSTGGNPMIDMIRCFLQGPPSFSSAATAFALLYASAKSSGRHSSPETS
jgi:hypothetical protein